MKAMHQVFNCWVGVQTCVHNDMVGKGRIDLGGNDDFAVEHNGKFASDIRGRSFSKSRRALRSHFEADDELGRVRG